MNDTKETNNNTLWEIEWMQPDHKNKRKCFNIKFNGVSLRAKDVEIYQEVGSFLHLKLSVIVFDQEIKFVDR